MEATLPPIRIGEVKIDILGRKVRTGDSAIHLTGSGNRGSRIQTSCAVVGTPGRGAKPSRAYLVDLQEW